MMKKFIYMAIALLLVSCGSDKTTGISGDAAREISSAKATVQSILSHADKGKFREGELLVKFRAGKLATSSINAHQAVGADVVRRLSLANIDHVRLPKGIAVEEAIVKYMQDPNVEFAEPNYIRRVSVTPNDTYFTQQWALRNLGIFANGTPGADIRAYDAWEVTRGSSAVVMAVLDTGIDYNHPDIVGNIWTNTSENPNNGIDDDGNGLIDDWRGWNFVSSSNDPLDDMGHGTHVAGIADAVGNNGTGISGLAWNLKLIPLKIFDSNGDGAISDEIAAIQYAVAKGAKIINGSFGGSEFSNAESDAISAANAAGVLFIASAGNGGEDGNGDNNDIMPQYPASYKLSNIVSVAATDQNDRLASFSNFGPASVHVAAPGVYILSTVTPGLSFSMCTGSPFAGYDFCDGTSMAAPYVSSLAALLYSHYNKDVPHFSYAQIRGMILKYVDTLSSSPNLYTLNGWIYTGGRINAYKALSALQTPTGMAASAASSSQVALSWSDRATGEDKYVIERKPSGGGFVKIAEVAQNITTYTDSGLSASTAYTYRVKATSTLPNPPSGTIEADSFYSNEASVTTLSSGTSGSSGGGGGGCSIGSMQDAPTAVADIALVLLPLAAMAFLRRRR